jgi:protein phosphatase 1L
MKIRYGAAESVGLRSRMEDSYALWEIEDQDLFGAEVYDGHNGSLAATIAAEILTPRLLSFLKTEKGDKAEPLTFRDQIRQAYLSTDTYIIGHGIESGAAAATLHIVNGKFCAANSGDSSVVIDTEKKAVQLTLDHKPDLPAEMARIRRLGGQVKFLDLPRLQGVLAISRALGDPQLRPFLTPEPRVVEGLLGRENRFAVVACDGLWNVLAPEEVMAMVRGAADPQGVADKIVARAIALGSTDNITVIVLDLKSYTNTLRRRKMKIIAVLDKAEEAL